MAGKIFKFLPKAASFSTPSNIKKKFFQGPAVSIVPDHCRGKSNESVKEDEPTSPEVSCIGQVNHKKDDYGSNNKKKKTTKTKTKTKTKKAPKRSSSMVIHRMLCHRVRDDSDDERGRQNEEVLVPHSAPILMGGGEVALEPKKEINIWMRRASPPPVPLQLNVVKL